MGKKNKTDAGIPLMWSPPEPPELPDSFSTEDVRRGYSCAPVSAGKEPFYMDRAERRRERHRLNDLYGDEYL